MSFIVGVVYGILIGLILCIIGGGAFLFWDIMDKKKYNRVIRIKNWTAGKPFVEIVRGQLTKHPELGMVYYIPKLKKESRHYIQYFGSDKEYPSTRSTEYFVPVSFLNGTYSPEVYDPYFEEEKDVIIYNESTKKYEKTTQKIKNFIVKPIKASIRQFNLSADTQIKDEFKEKQTFWDKYGGQIMGFGLGVIMAGIGLIAMIFLIQAGMDGNVPSLLRELINAVNNIGQEGIQP